MSRRRISLAIDENEKSPITILPAISTEKRFGDKKIRFMEYSDIPNVTKLMKEFSCSQTELTFGRSDISALWSKSYVSILLERDYEVIAAMILNNYPNVPSIPQNSWETWLKNKYDIELLTPYNSLWVHMFLFESQLRDDVIDAFMKFIFKTFLRIEFVAFVLPPFISKLAWLVKFGTVVTPNMPGKGYRLQRLVILRRICFISSYKIRRAVMEDNDDIVALLDRTCPEMKSQYGKHYIASIVHNKNDKRQVIVAEYKGTIVAAMIVNDEVNYNMMNLCFHLDVLHGLKKVDSRIFLPSELGHRSTMDSSAKSLILQLKHSNLSQFTLDTVQSGTFVAEANEAQPELDDLAASTSDVDFDIDLDLDTQSDSIDMEMESVEEKSTESMFIGHLEINMSCVVLSYTDSEIQKFMYSRKGPSVKMIDARQQKIKSFEGEPNAFAIEAIAVAKTHDFAVNLLFLASFECFPEKDYCLLSLPCTEETPPILKTFIRAHAKRDVAIAHELYICHKLCVMGRFSAREAHQNDGDDVADLIGNFRNLRIMGWFTTSLLDTHTSLRSYVFLCNKQIVGFAILDEELDVDYIHSHYYCKEALSDVSEMNISYGRIVFFTILPVFEKQTRFFLQELHRLSDYSKLYYSLNIATSRYVSCVISDMILAVPVISSEIQIDKFGNYPKSMFECRAAVSALFISTPLICAKQRIEVNTRIIVVGASDVALSFIISLLLKSNSSVQVQYNNLTVVSSHGLSKYNSTTNLIPSTSHINKITLDMHAVNAFVDVVEGVMTAINRNNRTIKVSNNLISYDILILACGLQYQMPKRSAELRKKRTENPENVFVVNTEVDATLCLERLKKIWSENQNNVIVYGHALNAYCCISTLLHLGLPEKFLVFVDFMPQQERLKFSQTSIFPDSSIEETILKNMKDRGVRLYRGFLYTWEFDEFERVKSVTFQCNTRRISFECIALFAYETKYVCQATLQAIQRAGLIFDGGLVITPDFKTNDPNIFAAGTCTKYPRRFYAEGRKHKYYNQVEIGRELAKMVAMKIMHTSVEDGFSSYGCAAKTKYFVPEYTDPLHVSCTLPGGIHYFCVRKPGPVADIGYYSQGEVLTTGDVSNLESQGYFRLHINKHGLIDEISCLSHEPIDTVNLTNVWGKHEVLFKKMYLRYKMGQITDFFKFFRGDEFQALYNHMFATLHYEMISVLLSKPDENERKQMKTCLIDDIIHLYKANNRQRFRQHHFRLMKKLFSDSVYEKKIIEMVMSFLNEHSTFLPMYAQPLVVKLILGGYKDSDLFKKNKRES